MKAFLPSLGVCALIVWGVSAWADTKPNESVIGLLAAEPQWLPVASTIATKLDHENGLRIVPMLGVGGVHGLQDLASMPMVDAAIVASDSLNYAVLQNILNGKQDQFSYVARLATLDVVVVSKRGINNVAELAGKRIATGPAQSAAFATGELLFNALNIPFTRIAKQDQNAIDALIAGEVDAALILGTDISTAALSDGRFHVLSLQIPQQLSKIYQPAILTAHELPGLLRQKQSVETVAASLTLAVFNRPRDAMQQRNLQNFETMMFKLSAGDGTGNLAAVVPGWKRHSEAQLIIEQTQAARTDSATITPTGGKP